RPLPGRDVGPELGASALRAPALARGGAPARDKLEARARKATLRRGLIPMGRALQANFRTLRPRDTARRSQHKYNTNAGDSKQAVAPPTPSQLNPCVVLCCTSFEGRDRCG